MGNVKGSGTDATTGTIDCYVPAAGGNGALIGGIVGGLAVAVIIGVICYKRKKAAAEEGGQKETFV